MNKLFISALILGALIGCNCERPKPQWSKFGTLISQKVDCVWLACYATVTTTKGTIILDDPIQPFIPGSECWYLKEDSHRFAGLSVDGEFYAVEK